MQAANDKNNKVHPIHLNRFFRGGDKLLLVTERKWLGWLIARHAQLKNAEDIAMINHKLLSQAIISNLPALQRSRLAPISVLLVHYCVQA